METALYVLDLTAPHSPFGIRPASAIAAVPSATEYLTCYFEGNVYNAANIKTYADRALHAVGRLHTKYPTAACMNIPRAALIPVGTFDDKFGEVRVDQDRRPLLASWIGVPIDELDGELETSDSSQALAARTLREMDRTPEGRLQSAWLRKNGPAPYRASSST
jgi:DMSO/TMAO reductase YedYZ molybdopterin-dependent catalytic subunit